MIDWKRAFESLAWATIVVLGSGVAMWAVVSVVAVLERWDKGWVMGAVILIVVLALMIYRSAS